MSLSFVIIFGFGLNSVIIYYKYVLFILFSLCNVNLRCEFRIVIFRDFMNKKEFYWCVFFLCRGCLNKRDFYFSI